MGAILSMGISLLFLGLFFWAINALSVLRNQMDEVIERLERIEGATTRRATPGAA
jgi:hypothetical protein